MPPPPPLDVLVDWALTRGEAAHGLDTPVSAATLADRLADHLTAYRRFCRLLDDDDPLDASVRGAVNGRYESLELVGRGGSGEVYKAWDRKLKRDVALKFLRVATPELRDRFEREAEILARMTGKHIAPIYDHGTDAADGRAFLVLRWMGGGSLIDRKREYVGRWERVTKLMGQVARAIHQAHAFGVCHRDLKPGNILLDDDGDAYVADFGVAKLVQTVGPEPVAAGRSAVAERHVTDGCGTPPYMAPEQFREEFGAVGPRTDVWAIGVVLYELLTGRRPFDGRTPAELEAAVCTEAPVAPRKIDRRIPRHLERICLKCLARRPEDRWATAGAVADALRPRARARTLQVVGLSVLLSAATLGGVWAYTRDRGFEPVQDELRTTGEVVLVDENRYPRHFQAVTAGVAHADRKPQPGNPFLATFAVRPGLLELVGHNPYLAYRVDAAVQPFLAGGWEQDQEVGVYFGRQEIDGTHHCLSVMVWYNKAFVDVSIRTHRLREDFPNPCENSFSKLAHIRLPHGSLTTPFSITIDVDPSRITAVVAGHTLRATLPPTGRLVMSADDVYQVSTRGGVGVYGCKGSFIVRTMALRRPAPKL